MSESVAKNIFLHKSCEVFTRIRGFIFCNLLRGAFSNYLTTSRTAFAPVAFQFFRARRSHKEKLRLKKELAEAAQEVEEVVQE